MVAGTAHVSDIPLDRECFVETRQRLFVQAHTAVRDAEPGQAVALARPVAQPASRLDMFIGVGASGTVGRVIRAEYVYTGEELCSSAAYITRLCGHVVIDAGNSSYCATAGDG